MDAKPANPPRRACAGLLRRKEVWTLSRRGWLVALAAAAALLVGLLLGIHPFLAVTDRAQADVLVVEGWIPNYALLESWKEFESGHYRTLFTTGVLAREELRTNPEDNHATWAKERLEKMLGPKNEIIAVPAQTVKRDRTYASAVALKKWLDDHHQRVAAINVVTIGAHARRSRLLYQKAFGADTTVGIIALPDEEYEQDRWWKYSEGVREVMSEGVAYLYARLFFYSDN